MGLGRAALFWTASMPGDGSDAAAEDRVPPWLPRAQHGEIAHRVERGPAGQTAYDDDDDDGDDDWRSCG